MATNLVVLRSKALALVMQAKVMTSDMKNVHGLLGIILHRTSLVTRKSMITMAAKEQDTFAKKKEIRINKCLATNAL